MKGLQRLSLRPSGGLRPLIPGLRRSHPTRKNHAQVSALLNKTSAKSKDSAEETVVIPLNYAQLLGLRGREFYLDPQITSAFEDLAAFELDSAYSSVARLGKEKLLVSAREGLRTARGRVSLIHPDISVEPVLLPGAMAVLEQAGEYELVIQLAQQAKSITGRDLKSNNRATLRDFERDATLATALAHCGFAKRELEAGHPAMGCARLEEALYTLRDGPGGSANLAPELQANIIAALSDLKPDALLDYLSQPLELAEVAMRKQALEALANMLMQPDKTKSTTPITQEYAAKALSTLTSFEICSFLDWRRIIANAEPYPWFTHPMIPQIGLAHIVAGFTARKPELITAAKSVLQSAAQFSAETHIDVAIHMVVCDVLLGAPCPALDRLKEDEQHGEMLRQKAGLPPMPARARSAYSAAAAAASLAFPERDGVMRFIRAASPEGDADLLPGLCLFVEQWLQRLAFPLLRDSKENPPLASLAAYFDDPYTEQYLESRERMFNLSAAVKRISNTVLNVFSSLITNKKQIVYASGAVVATALFIAVSKSLMATQRRSLSGQAPGGSAAAVAPSIKKIKPSTTLSTANKALLSKDTAHRLVKEWLSIKAEAMGPRHNIVRLKTVLAEPMLGAVTSEAKEAASSGWFWNIRPLKTRIVSIDESTLTPEGGYATVIATVDESADLWATNGKKGDCYKTEYKVEYSMVRSKTGGWKLASALVLGK